jgi:hypothetical protein
MIGSKIQLLMRDITTGEEKVVMYNVNSIEDSADSRLKSLLKIESETGTALKDTVQFSLSKGEMEPYDTLKPINCFDSKKRGKSSKRSKISF